MDTYLCSKKEDLAYVLDHLPELVVKAVGESGGYGMLMGPTADRDRIEDFEQRIKADPRNYIAQHVLPAFARALLRSGAWDDCRPPRGSSPLLPL